ncbi:MAG TPA: hotdog fold thioesterase [Rubrobacter sp.]|nr:hotdog fold thioesterase [Rubrobacter sp.]
MRGAVLAMRKVGAVDIEAVLKRGEGITKNLGVEFVELTRERVVATMPVDERHHQPLGYLHGGVSVVLAESVASTGAFLNCPPGKVAFGSEISASHVRPKQSGTLTAVAVPAHVGRRSQVWEVRITDEDDKTVCVSRCTVAVVDGG